MTTSKDVSMGYAHIKGYIDSIEVGSGRGARSAAFYGSPGMLNVQRDGNMSKLYLAHSGTTRGSATMRLEHDAAIDLIRALAEVHGLDVTIVERSPEQQQ